MYIIIFIYISKQKMCFNIKEENLVSGSTYKELGSLICHSKSKEMNRLKNQQLFRDP